MLMTWEIYFYYTSFSMCQIARRGTTKLRVLEKNKINNGRKIVRKPKILYPKRISLPSSPCRNAYFK